MVFAVVIYLRIGVGLGIDIWTTYVYYMLEIFKHFKNNQLLDSIFLKQITARVERRHAFLVALVIFPRKFGIAVEKRMALPLLLLTKNRPTIITTFFHDPSPTCTSTPKKQYVAHWKCRTCLDMHGN